MAGKLHAVLCRKWQNQVKGRDWHDLVWYAGRRIHPHLLHLAARMAQTGHWPEGKAMSSADLHTLLEKRIAEVDFAAAADDVRPFSQGSSGTGAVECGVFPGGGGQGSGVSVY